MAKTNNIPPGLEAIVVEAIRRCELARDSRDPKEIRKEIRDEIAKRITGTDAERAAFIPAYMGSNLARVIKYAMDFADSYKPTHRKGYGDESVTEINDPGRIIFKHSGGTSGGPGGGDGGEVPDPTDGGDDGDDGEFVDEVPGGEQDRARAVMAQVGIAPYDDPLEFVRTVAKILGGNWGLNGKRGNPGNPSGDILAYKLSGGGQPQLFDVLIDSGRSNKITWQQLSYPQSAGAVWIAP